MLKAHLNETFSKALLTFSLYIRSTLHNPNKCINPLNTVKGQLKNNTHQNPKPTVYWLGWISAINNCIQSALSGTGTYSNKNITFLGKNQSLTFSSCFGVYIWIFLNACEQESKKRKQLLAQDIESSDSIISTDIMLYWGCVIIWLGSCCTVRTGRRQVWTNCMCMCMLYCTCAWTHIHLCQWMQRWHRRFWGKPMKGCKLKS